MECRICWRWTPADRSTGYDADAICPECAAEGWIETSGGQLIREDVDEFEDDELTRSA